MVRKTDETSGEMIKSAFTLAVLLFFTMAVGHPAYAYIDPNTGGLLLQILTPILGIIVFFWRRVLSIGRQIVDKLFGRKSA